MARGQQGRRAQGGRAQGCGASHSLSTLCSRGPIQPAPQSNHHVNRAMLSTLTALPPPPPPLLPGLSLCGHSQGVAMMRAMMRLPG